MLEFIQPTIEFITRGGIMLLPIIFCSWIATSIIVERLWNFRRTRVNRRELMSELGASLKRKKVIEAVSICDKIPRPLARVVKAGLLKHDRDKPEIKEAMQEAGQEEIIDLERYLPILGTLVYLTPLLGLLGTVMGMIRTFINFSPPVSIRFSSLGPHNRRANRLFSQASPLTTLDFLIPRAIGPGFPQPSRDAPCHGNASSSGP